MADKGHNSGIDVSKLKGYFERIERLHDEQKVLAEDIKEVKLEAKAAGFGGRAFTKAYSLWRMDKDDRAALGVYVDALGVFDVLD